MKRNGFTLVEVMIATIILAVGLMAVTACMMRAQQLMLSSRKFEISQKVLAWAEMAYPIPDADDVTDPLTDTKLNISERSADEILQELQANDVEIELDYETRKNFEGYRFSREVDEIDDEELRRRRYFYTVRTIVRWGSNYRNSNKEEEVVISFFRKSEGGGNSKAGEGGDAK